MTRPPGGRTDGTAPGARSAERRIMRPARRDGHAPRGTDTLSVAALQAVLRDEDLVARACANVEQWPPLTDDQRDALAALLARSRRARR